MRQTNKFNAKSLKIVNKTILSLLILSIGIETSYANTDSQVAGKTILAKGTVHALNMTLNTSRALKRRSKIMSIDHIKTGEKSKAQFSMSDGGLITLKENSEINISNYIFNKETQKGSATIEVITGGLRSISGLIKKTGGDYQVKTPVGSIGIRGTHFAVEVVNDNVYFGVYSGNIDIKLKNNEVLSLGVTESFAFASVNELNEVTSYTQAPKLLSIGYITSEYKDSLPKTSASSTNNAQVSTSEAENSAPTSINDINLINSAFSNDVYTELTLEETNTSNIAELISQRTGTFNYQEITESNITSSVGVTNNLSLNLEVNFDSGTIPGGSLSFTDEQGEWFAAYSGLINVDQLEIGVNFASHANQRVDGEISAAFTNGLSEITGNFNLSEVEDPSVNAVGSFKIK